VKIFDVLGREVETLVNEIQKPGNYEVTFNAGKYASGVYYYQLKAGDYIQTKKMILLK
jgi:5-hydroxyisourate hydrolase-like protein (transthyretin family)